MLLFSFPFWRLVFDTIWCCVLDLVISTYFLSNIFNGETCLIYINLCTFHVKKNSARLQWYSCARYKAPGPLVFKRTILLLIHFLQSAKLTCVDDLWTYESSWICSISQSPRGNLGSTSFADVIWYITEQKGFSIFRVQMSSTQVNFADWRKS